LAKNAAKKKNKTAGECQRTKNGVVFPKERTTLGGGFKYLLFSSLVGEDFQFD